jgi:hypothetical protein
MYPGNRRRTARRWLRGGLIYLAGFGAFMVIGLVVVVAIHPGPLGPASSPARQSAPPRTPASAPSSPALGGPLQLIRGRDLVQGVYLGYPHSTTGAVSAAAEYITGIVSTLDPDRAAAVMRLAADPSYADGPQQAAEGAVNDRKGLGIPASGPVPAGDSLTTTPVEYQVRDTTPDSVTVLLLSDFITTIAGQGTQTRIAVFPLRMHWAQGDWKLLGFSPSDYSGLSAEPDSPKAAADGWQDLEPA